MLPCSSGFMLSVSLPSLYMHASHIWLLVSDSKDLVESHIVSGWYYAFFGDLALLKEGTDWDSEDLVSVVEFLADLRGR